MAMTLCTYQNMFASLDAARERLAGRVAGDDNILSARDGFMPPDISGVRSAPAWIFRVNDTAEAIYKHGIVGIDDFWEYPE
jgi:hypothetical protein